MNKEEIVEAISEDKTMPFIQPEQLSGIVDFVIKNYKPSLPSNLEDAAEEIASNIAPTHPDIGWVECFEKIKDGIKAGAEWMAGQGESVTATVVKYNDSKILSYDQEFAPVVQGLNYGDKVVVQIRKK